MQLIRFLIECFDRHPKDNGMSYIQHFFRALRFSMLLGCASVACVIHAVFPFLFERTASDIITHLYNEKRD